MRWELSHLRHNEIQNQSSMRQPWTGLPNIFHPSKTSRMNNKSPPPSGLTSPGPKARPAGQLFQSPNTAQNNISIQ